MLNLLNSLKRIRQGYIFWQSSPPAPGVRAAVFEEPAASPSAVLVGDVEFFSTGRRDLVPFSGVCHVAYLPGRAPGGGAAGRLVRDRDSSQSGRSGLLVLLR